MRNTRSANLFRATALAAAAAFLAACHGGAKNVSPDKVRPENVPASFDVTLEAAKDNQFDYDPDGGSNGAPLTVEDLRGALRYRIEEHLPVQTVLLKRSDKQRITKEHIAYLARVAQEMKFKAFMLEKDGGVSELVPTGRGAEPADEDKK
jgi:hypothetical protein